MSRPGFRWRVVACGAAVVFGVAGCTSSSADGPSSTSPLTVGSPSVIDPSADSAAPASSSAASPTPSVIDVPIPSSAPPSSSDPPAQEAADRASIEAQWVKFWEIYPALSRSPEAQRPAIAGTVAVDAALSSALEDAQTLSEKGLDTYGSVVHKISWPIPMSDSVNAVIADCMDQSNAGNYDIATNTKRTVGVANNNLRGTLVRGSDGVWRVSSILAYTEEPC